VTGKGAANRLAAIELTISADDPGVPAGLVHRLAAALVDSVVLVTTRDGDLVELTVGPSRVPPEDRLCGATHWQRGDPAPMIGLHAIAFDRIARVHVY
jgi:hypothetical protein